MPAVKIHHTDTVDEPWAGAEQVANLGDDYTTADLKGVFAWIPGGEDPAKSQAKFPHHEVDADGKPGAANIKGCEAAIGVLNGAMGGADIPDSDRQGVYDHLAAHLKDGDVTPAELKSAPAPDTAPTAATVGTVADAAARSLSDVSEAGVEMRLNTGTAVLPAPAFATGGLVRGPGVAASDHSGADLSARAAFYGKAMGTERRNTPFRAVEMRSIPNGTGGSKYLFTGYACVTEVGYEMQDWLGPFVEVVRRGAFTKTLSENADVAFLLNHTGMTLARTKPGTLRLSEDDTGLYCEADLDPTNPQVQALHSAMARGDIDEMSFAFWVTRQQWSPDYEQRDILEVVLNKGDVSAVNYGANPNTAGAQMNARDLAAHLAQLPADARREVHERLAAEFGGSTAPLLLTDTASMRAFVADCTKQLREGKALSAATMEVLEKVLDLIASADDAVDAAQPMLADLMGVPNPDAEDEDDSAEDPSDGPDGDDDDGGDEGEPDEQYNAAPVPALDLMRMRARALDLRAA